MNQTRHVTRSPTQGQLDRVPRHRLLASPLLVFGLLVGLLVSVQSVFAQTIPTFEDVPDGHVAEAAIEWAAENEITAGVGNNRFGIGQTLTRYEMVTFLCRAFSPNDCLTGNRGSDRFDDVPFGHWANHSVGWAVNQGITSGVSATEFGGPDTLTREQMVPFLFRARGRPTGGSLGSDVFEDVPDDPAHWANLPIGWSFDQGITGGIAGGTFGFGTNLSREEMVLFLCRTLAPGTCEPSQQPLVSSVVPATTTTSTAAAAGAQDSEGKGTTPTQTSTCPYTSAAGDPCEEIPALGNTTDDVNCGDIPRKYKPLTVVGQDYDRLDRDNDRQACNP